MDEKVIVERTGRVMIVTLNDPDSRNAVDPEMAALLTRAFQQFEGDDDIYVAVLAGNGPSFCGGYNLNYFAEHGFGSEYRSEGPGALGISRMVPLKPVVGAIQGYAVAGGLELALWCDIRIAEETTKFGVFCRRWGVPLVDGGTHRLPRIIGQGRALEMILTGRPVMGPEALSWGLANQIVAEGQARGTAIALAKDIARFPRHCVLADRMSTITQWGLSVEDALLREAEGAEHVIEAEAREGAHRFASGMGRGGDFGNI